MSADPSTQQFVIRLFAVTLVGALAAGMGMLFFLAVKLDGEIAQTLVQLLAAIVGTIVAAIAGLGALHLNRPAAPIVPAPAPPSAPPVAPPAAS